MVKLPPISVLMDPVLVAVDTLGGCATNDEIRVRVTAAFNPLADQAAARYGENDSRTELEYRLAWARTHLRNQNFLDSPGKKQWRLTDAGQTRAHERKE